MMQNRITELERENEDASNALRTRSAEQSRLRDLEDQVRFHQDRYNQQGASFERLRQDFDELQSRSQGPQASNDSDRLREEVSRLQQERAEAENLANELRDEVTSLADELRSVNAKYEALLDEREKDTREHESRDEEAKTWKKRYEQAKTELRNLKGELDSTATRLRPDRCVMQPRLKFSPQTFALRATSYRRRPMASSPTSMCPAFKRR